MKEPCFIDVHCHLDSYNGAEISKIVKECREEDVRIIVNNGVDPKTNRKILELIKKFPEVKAALGIYPIEALKMSNSEIDKEIEFIRKNKDKIIAIGEVGIDLKWSKDLEKQKEIFKRFISLSIELNKPIIVHSRNAEEECIKILEELKAEKVVTHCFSGKTNLVERIIKNKWFLSIPANVNFSEQFQKIVEIAPIENLLTETDSPYLHPLKERNNTPKNVVYSYKKISEIKKMDIKEVKKEIFNNYNKIFNL